jgi:hypothetical protein
MTKSILYLIAVLILYIKETDSIIVRSISRVAFDPHLVKKITSSVDQKQDRPPVQKPLKSYVEFIPGRRLLSEEYMSGIQNIEGHIEAQARNNPNRNPDTSNINPGHFDNHNKIRIAKQGATNRLRRDIIFTAPPEHFTTIRARIKTTHPLINVIQTAPETTPEAPHQFPSTATAKTSVSEQSSEESSEPTSTSEAQEPEETEEQFSTPEVEEEQSTSETAGQDSTSPIQKSTEPVSPNP